MLCTGLEQFSSLQGMPPHWGIVLANARMFKQKVEGEPICYGRAILQVSQSFSGGKYQQEP
jgi:hypothetical protein